MTEPITSFTGDHAFLSNFYACEVRVEGVVFPSSEHAFQAMKTLDPGDRATIAIKATPGDAKHAGRKLKLRPHWDEIRTSIMRQVVLAKFNQNPALRARLVATGDAELIEGNSWSDYFWGAVRTARGTWAGQNFLGHILMEIREELRD